MKNVPIRTIATILSSLTLGAALIVFAFSMNSRQSNEEIMVRLAELADWSCVENIDRYYFCKAYERANRPQQTTQTSPINVVVTTLSMSGSSCTKMSVGFKLYFRDPSWWEMRKIKTNLNEATELTQELIKRSKVDLFTPTENEEHILAVHGWNGKYFGC